ncbi:tetratricopeptide repeat protein [Rubrobacter naiadicus]|uniref:tetratricopeptide repeat protein n=1 Tax=Rubrobacter naiadicus TaxID=1392641 RepID=UPI0023616E44|nr:tetratricopeptide repeat protein [Rubrobacter naiadicus]
MGSGATLPVILLLVILIVSWQLVYTANKDLVRTKAWGYFGRRLLPYAILVLMALSLFFIRSVQQEWALMTWAGVFAVAVIASNIFSSPAAERRANRAFRRKDYEDAAEQYRLLVQSAPLARHYTFLSAALAATERYEEAAEAATEAIRRDPEYGLAYYNRAMVERRLGHKGRAIKDLRRSLEADLPRRFKGNVHAVLEEMTS